MRENYEEDIKWFKKEAELHELAMQQNKDRMQTLEEDLHKTESERDVYKAAIDEMADNVAAVWQSGPAPKDGSWILGMFNGAPHVVYWDSWETGETVPGEHESGWVLARDTVVAMDEDEPARWARIIPPNRVQPAPWENEVFGGAGGTP